MKKTFTTWHMIKGMGTIIAIIISIIAIGTLLDNRYALADSSTKIHNAQIKAIQTIQKQLVMDREKVIMLYDLQQNSIKINSLMDRKYKLKDLVKKYPKDIEIKEDYISVKEELLKLKNIMLNSCSLSDISNI